MVSLVADERLVRAFVAECVDALRLESVGEIVAAGCFRGFTALAAAVAAVDDVPRAERSGAVVRGGIVAAV